MNPEQQQVPIFEQTTLNGAFIDVVPTPDGSVILTITIPATGKQFVIPMSADAAKEIGAKLIAPHIVPAGAGGLSLNGNGH